MTAWAGAFFVDAAATSVLSVKSLRSGEPVRAIRHVKGLKRAVGNARRTSLSHQEESPVHATSAGDMPEPPTVDTKMLAFISRRRLVPAGCRVLEEIEQERHECRRVARCQSPEAAATRTTISSCAAELSSSQATIAYFVFHVHLINGREITQKVPAFESEILQSRCQHMGGGVCLPMIWLSSSSYCRRR